MPRLDEQRGGRPRPAHTRQPRRRGFPRIRRYVRVGGRDGPTALSYKVAFPLRSALEVWHGA
jgi:hypothetical protein